MSTNLFSIELIGGPADGLQVATNNIPGRMLQRSKDGLGASHSRLAQYDLTDSRYGVDASGLPMIEMKYAFVGTTATSGRRGLAGFAGRLPAWAVSCRRGIAAWMMAPINYPMQIRHTI